VALGAWLRPRVRLLATAGTIGVVAGALALLALAAVRTPEFASTQTFAVGALVLGFAVLGWSGSALAGRGIESLQTYLDADTGWTERDSRRAMARLSGFGAGVMVGVVIATTLLM
jgi:hypothetical protein